LARRIDPRIARSLSELLGRGRSRSGSRLGLGVAMVRDINLRGGRDYPVERT